MKCILSQTATGDIKSKVINKQLAVISLDCYITPKEFAEIIEKYGEKEITIEIK